MSSLGRDSERPLPAHTLNRLPVRLAQGPEPVVGQASSHISEQAEAVRRVHGLQQATRGNYLRTKKPQISPWLENNGYAGSGSVKRVGEPSFVLMSKQRQWLHLTIHGGDKANHRKNHDR